MLDGKYLAFAIAQADKQRKEQLKQLELRSDYSLIVEAIALLSDLPQRQPHNQQAHDKAMFLLNKLRGRIFDNDQKVKPQETD